MARFALVLLLFGALQPLCAAVRETVVSASDPTALAYFGTSVATQYETLIVGAPGHDNEAGAVYVYELNGSDWIEKAKLDSPGVTLFGTAVALNEDTLTVAAIGDDDAGVVFVYTKSGDSWVEQAQVTADDSSVDAQFGNQLALKGDTLVVSATGDDELGKNAGAVYVITRNSDEWTLAYKLFGSDLESNDQFGSALAMDGDTLVVGAYGDDDEGSRAGAAYVLVRDGSGTWLEQAKLTASNGGRGHVFGRGGMAVFGDTVAIGAERYEDGSGVRTGTVYIYTRDGTEWVETAQVTATEGDQGDLFGKSLALYEDSLVVGSQGDDEKVNSGAVYVYSRSGQTWTEESKIKASDADNGDKLGSSVALFDTTLVAGALARDDGAGTVYVFDLAESQTTPCGFLLYDVSVEPARLLAKLESDQEPYNIHSYDVTARDVSIQYVSCKEPASVTFAVEKYGRYPERSESCFREAPISIAGHLAFLGRMELSAVEHLDENCEDAGNESVQFNVTIIDNPCERRESHVKAELNCITCATDGTSVTILNPNRRLTQIWVNATELPNNEIFMVEACVEDRFCVEYITENMFRGSDTWDFRVFYNGVMTVTTGAGPVGNPIYTAAGNCPPQFCPFCPPGY